MTDWLTACLLMYNQNIERLDSINTKNTFVNIECTMSAFVCGIASLTTQQWKQ